MEESWNAGWAMELAAEAWAYVRIYDRKALEEETGAYGRARMEKWMQYRILRTIGEELGGKYKSVAFSDELDVARREMLLYNERENALQYQALYEALSEPWKSMAARLLVHQQMVLRNLSECREMYE